MFTKEMLVKEFVKNNWDDTSVTVDTGDVVWITPCGYGTISSLEDCEYFLMNSDVVYLCGHDHIDGVVETLNKFDELKQESYSEEEKLREFFNEHLRYATEEDWALAGKVFDVLYKMERASTEHKSWHDFADAHMGEVADTLGITVEYAKKMHDLSSDASWYSDWYKDVYGHRPRW